MPRRKRAKLEITCTSSACDQGLHCFKSTEAMRKRSEDGRCRACGASLVDWNRVHQRDELDLAYTFNALKLEMIRHHFWHIPIDEHAVNHARRKGWRKLRQAVERRLEVSIGQAEPVRDGMQTPRKGNSIYYAQHAMACCCRKCLEYWHGLPQGRELETPELSYLADLCMLFLRERLPMLTEEGEKVPPIRSKRKPRLGDGRGEEH